jgi:hypothetical protein
MDERSTHRGNGLGPLGVRSRERLALALQLKRRMRNRLSEAESLIARTAQDYERSLLGGQTSR